MTARGKQHVLKYKGNLIRVDTEYEKVIIMSKINLLPRMVLDGT